MPKKAAKSLTTAKLPKVARGGAAVKPSLAVAGASTSSQPCVGLQLLRHAHALDEWAFVQAEGRPGLVHVIQTTRAFIRTFLLARFVWAAVQQSPRRSVSGKESAIEFLEQRIPRSTLYKFLNTDLGLANDSNLNEFRRCRDMDEVVAACPPLKELSLEVQHLYQEHQESIREQLELLEAV